jgi:hypothetical protein
MKLCTDHYRTGKSRHKSCEDYTLSGSEPMPYLIVCDGCSSSPQTDIGAMLLAVSARNHIREMITSDSVPPDYHTFGHEVIRRAAASAALLGIPQPSLDATLLAAVYIGGHVFVYVYGDGFVITTGRDGVHIHEIRFESNAPYYLSYLLNQDRRNAYQRELDKPKIIADGQTINLPYHAPVFFDFQADELSLLMLGSDGLSSFTDMQGNPLAAREVIEEFIAFKNFKGEFVKRRAKRAITEFEKRLVVNTDDLSVAAMYFNTVKILRS